LQLLNRSDLEKGDKIKMVNPYYEGGGITLYYGDCMKVLAGLAAESICFSTIITDPPYGTKLMGKVWDHGVPGERFWKRFAMLSCPGTMLLSFGGTRTWHRLAVAIEDAGWEIRDTLMYMYGTGFPKSHSISRAIDKEAGAKRKVVGVSPNWRESKRDRERFGSMEVRGDNAGSITVPATPAAQLWDGYGTALKPAWEPIILAMNPLDGTYANNALKHGVAGLNIDGGRIETEENLSGGAYAKRGSDRHGGEGWGYERKGGAGDFEQPHGRWPINLIHDGSDEVLAEFPIIGGKNPARFFYTAKVSRSERNVGCDSLYWRYDKPRLVKITEKEWEDLPKKRRAQGNIHPTVKPLSLMKYLCRLTKMPTDIDLVLDPFMGSGSTLVACVRTGRTAIGIDSDEAACEIAAKRVDAAKEVD
jgi:site-specific DNA-methyltransferase (adenine-specific)